MSRQLQSFQGIELTSSDELVVTNIITININPVITGYTAIRGTLALNPDGTKYYKYGIEDNEWQYDISSKSNQFGSLPNKSTLSNDDRVLIEDSQDNYTKKYVNASNLSGGNSQTPIFGSNYTYVSDLTDSITSSTNFQTKIQFDVTTSGTTGVYRLGWSYFWNLNSTGSDFRARIIVNDIYVIQDHRQEPKDSAGSGINGTDQRIPASGIVHFTVPAGNWNIKLQYCQSGGTSASIFESRMEFWRVS